ncbi:hypothetical protein H8S90_25295 [Olivibacter sp. SDN3]|nr:hypothetical protein [Olivibacter sp. SDN3]QNL49960.1 hypothetical protein H8S90_25295 [Olivibacter sp. SDN3]
MIKFNKTAIVLAVAIFMAGGTATFAQDNLVKSLNENLIYWLLMENKLTL